MFVNIHCSKLYMNFLFLTGLFAAIFENGICLSPVSDNTGIFTYSRNSLIDLRDELPNQPSSVNGFHLENLPPDLLWNNRNFNRSKKRKRGKKGGIRVKNRKRFKRLPLPSMLFGNIRSLTQKEDELYANIRYLHEYRESGIICLQETWLKDEHPDPSIPDFMTIRHDRTGDSKKKIGGGLLTLVNEKWCKNICVNHRYCDADIELLSVSLRPFYLPREFNSLKVINVYIPPNGNYMSACEI